MISISGIEHQETLEQMPLFNKNEAGVLIGKRGRNLDKKIAQLTRKKYLLPIKKGWYTTSTFFAKHESSEYLEFLAGKLRAPAYVSQEYVLAKWGIIPESVFAITCVTTKSSRVFKTPLGTFIYQSIKPEFFHGFQVKQIAFGEIYEASPAKALFDFLYFKHVSNWQAEIASDLRLNWEAWGEKNLAEFTSLVEKSNSIKMKKISKLIKKYVA